MIGIQFEGQLKSIFAKFNDSKIEVFDDGRIKLIRYPGSEDEFVREFNIDTLFEAVQPKIEKKPERLVRRVRFTGKLVSDEFDPRASVDLKTEFQVCVNNCQLIQVKSTGGYASTRGECYNNFQVFIWIVGIPQPEIWETTSKSLKIGYYD